LNLASATALVSCATIASAVIQPIFGIWSDRLTAPLLAPLGVALAALGIGCVGFSHSYIALALALALSGVGVALFHPEGARMAGFVGGGSVRGMSYFSVGGNAGFALGPPVVLLVLAIGGLRSTWLLMIPGLAIAGLLLAETERLKTHLPPPRPTGTQRTPPPAAWGPFSRLAGAAVLRTAAFYALLTFVPVYAIHHLGASRTLGDLLLTVMLVSGATGTLVGSRCADRFGKRLVLVWGMLPLTALLVLMPHVGLLPFVIVLAMVGFTVDGPFATTVVLGQQYLPGRKGLASGITLGLAIGLGGLLATGLGALADSIGVHSILETLPIFTALALLLAHTLPEKRTEIDA